MATNLKEYFRESTQTAFTKIKEKIYTKTEVDNALSIKVSSDITGVTGASQVVNMVSISQADYDALTPDANTLYVIGI